MKKVILQEIICTLLIVLFVYTGFSKLIHHTNFQFQLLKSPYISNLAVPVSVLLPSLELLAGALLIFQRTRLAGLYLSFFLLLLFTGYIFSMLHFSYYIPCACGGVLSVMSWEQHFIFNVIFTLLSVGSIFLMAVRGESE